MISELQNDGLVLLNTSDEAVPDQATIIILGVARSGTSMVAAVLYKLGIFIGDDLDKAVFEDNEMVNPLATGGENLKACIQARNSQHNVWGFKRPDIYKTIADKIELFRNPRFIIMFRDPLAIAKRNIISMREHPMQALCDGVSELAQLVQFASDVDRPALLISYEKAMQNKGLFLTTLTQFCGVKCHGLRLLALKKVMVNGPPLYLKSSFHIFETEVENFEGAVKGIYGNYLKGWARKIDDKRPLEIIVRCSDEIIGRGIASDYWKKLEKAGKHDGNCGFTILLSRKVKLQDITIYVKSLL